MARIRPIRALCALALTVATSSCTDTPSPPTPFGNPTFPVAPAAVGVGSATATATPTTFAPQGTARGPSWNSPVALTANDSEAWVVSPDTNQVMVVLVAGDANTRTNVIDVGQEPRSVVINQDSSRAYVVNQLDGTVTVINAQTKAVVATVRVGTEPFGAALSPNGTRLYVANTYSNNVSVIDTATNAVVATIPTDRQPRAVAVTNNGNASDTDETVYVTHFLAFPTAGAVETKDNSREGRVTTISAASNAVSSTITLPPITNTGFFNSGAFPNALESIAIFGTTAFIPGLGTSPDATGPVQAAVPNELHFQQNIHALMNGVSTTSNQSAFSTASLNTPGGFGDSANTRLAIHFPIGVAFKPNAAEGYVVSSGSNFIARFRIGANGPLMDTSTGPITVGENPRGIAINSAGTRGYVMNYVSRDLSVVNLSSNAQSARVPLAAVPADTGHLGKRLFFASVESSQAGQNRLSTNGWGSCAGCHPGNGLTDGAVWKFITGPRKVIPLNGTFDSGRIRVLNYSAVRDEVQDFELNIRNVSGGSGLIAGTPTSDIPNLFPKANAGRSTDQDALAAFIRTIRTPRSPVSASAVAQGRTLYQQAGCNSCHTGPNWSGPLVTFSPPPAPPGTAGSPITTTANPGLTFGPGQIAAALFKVGTFTNGNPIEVRARANAKALGEGGFNPSSLLGIHAFPPFFHDGSAKTLEETIDDNHLVHRRAGLASGAADPLNDAGSRQALIEFVRSIDSTTTPFTRP